MTGATADPLAQHERNIRAEWESIADELIDAARCLRTADGAGVAFSGSRPSDNGPDIDALEGFARSFWLAACRMPHADAQRREEIAADYIDGLRAGPSIWPSTEIPQTMVESASIAFGLWASRKFTWDRLETSEQESLARYLLAAVDRPDIIGNWLLFRVLTHAVLRSFGLPIPLAPTLDALDCIENYYRGDGWYSDGGDSDARKFDYYNAWSFNTYPLIWALIEGDRLDPSRTSRFRERSAALVEWLPRLIGAEGAPLYQGRSLIYRAGMTAPLWAAELAGARIKPGVAIGVSTRVLRWFVAHDSFPAGVATLGWTRPFPAMAQGYSGPGSPLWLSKAFLGLLLPSNHAAWRADPAELPIDRGDFISAAVEPGWLVSATGRDGIVRVLNHGAGRRRDEIDPHSAQLRDDANYNRLAYSTVTAPTLDGARLDEPGGLPDNAVVVRDRRGRIAVRTPPKPIAVTDGLIASRFDLVVPETEEKLTSVCVVSLCHGPFEVRLLSFDRYLDEVSLTGWPVSGGDIDVHIGTSCRLVADGILRSELLSLGASVTGTEPAGPTAFGDRTGVPFARFTSVGPDEWCGVLLSLSADSQPVQHLADVEVRIDRDRVEVRWPGGTSAQVDLAPIRTHDSNKRSSP